MRSRKTTSRTCEQCNRQFDALVENVQRGNGRYCSRKCVNSSLHRPLDEAFWDKVSKQTGANDARDCCLEMLKVGQTARTMADLVTPKQLVAIRAISHAQRVNAETECLTVMGCKPEELNRRSASAFISYLKSIDQSAARRVA